MSFSISPVLTSRPDKTGKYPIAIRITKDRKSSFKFIGHSIEKKEWDNKKRKVKSNHSNSNRLNAYIRKKISEFEKAAFDMENDERAFVAKDVTESSKSSRTDFFVVAKSYLANLKAEGKYNRHSPDKARIDRFETFLKTDSIQFKEITVSKLRDFKAYLIGTHKVSERSVMNTMVVLRTIFNIAIKSGHLDSKYYPFGHKFKITFPPSEKVGLTKEELLKFMKADLSGNPKHIYARNIFLSSFYLAGIRIGDLLKLKWSSITDGRLHYTMGKNNKPGSIKLNDAVIDIFESYRDVESDLIFPDLRHIEENLDERFELEKHTKNKIRNINKYLKKISEELNFQKKITCHTARHTFGNLSANKIPVRILQQLFRHSHASTTQIYMQNFIHEEADEALDSVVNL